MSDFINLEKNFTLQVGDPKDFEMICKVGKALANPERLLILRSILGHPKYLSDISRELNIPISSVSRHIDALADAQLICINYQPGLKGHTKFCTQIAVSFTVQLCKEEVLETSEPEYTVEMPLGMFTHCDITAPCGMTGKDDNIEYFDDPSVFFSPERRKAECLWFNTGFITYSFPTTALSRRACSEISFSFEVCSETSYYNNVWPSDITVFINGKEIVTFTSPGDFGGRRGKYTPERWAITSTQFGLLKKVTVNGQGVFVDNRLENKKITFADLGLYDAPAIEFRIGVKDDAVHRGGINLFGKDFGDYPQSIIMTLK